MSEIVRFSKDEQIFRMAQRLYLAVQNRLLRLLPQADIRHVGSTAVPGSMTKGDLDVVVRVQPNQFATAEELLAREFKRNAGSDRTDDFAAFMDDSTVPDLGVQLVAIGGSADTFQDPNLRREYDALKLSFEGRDMQEYRAAKSEFIASRLQR